MLEQLRATLDGHAELLIIPHNDPDPDAIAAAFGLRYLAAEAFGIKAHIRYQGMIGRAENKTLVSYLKHPLRRLQSNNLDPKIPIALVDTQPGAGNHPLTTNFPPRIVIDHHTWREPSSKADFVDVRPDIGATATILTEYIQAADIKITPSLATALFYGIKTDTMGLGRGASPDDTAAYFFLQPKINVEALIQIERAQVPESYFKRLNQALQATRVYDDLAISYLGLMNYPDLGAEFADLIWRLKGVKWVICMGVYEDEMNLSVRSRSRKIGAGNLVQHIVGDLGTAGGHGTMAGGHIPLKRRDPVQLFKQLAGKTLQYVKGDDLLDGKPLI